MNPERWEVGSEFHWQPLTVAGAGRQWAWSSGILLSTGRDALRLALAQGRRDLGWRRLWVPDYFCQSVLAAIVSAGLELRPYVDDPVHGPRPPRVRRGDAVLVMNFFGLRASSPLETRSDIGIVEDHSHDPESAWARSSTADFCIASLRKTMPMPDGGVAWSPRGHALPGPVPLTLRRRRAAGLKTSAMLLKALYLAGGPVEKATYRELEIRGEAGLGGHDDCAISEVGASLAATWPIDTWREARAANHALLRRLLAGVGWLDVVRPETSSCAPLSCVVVVDTPERRERVRRCLMEAQVYPAILWPLEDTVVPVGRPALDVSRRMLSLPCDGRYGEADIRRIAGLVAEAGT